MKNFLLAYSIKKNLKNNTVQRKNTPYEDAKSFLIMFTAHGNESFKRVRHLEELLRADGKEIAMLYLVQKENELPDVGLDEGMIRLEKKDISLFGEIRNEDVNEVLEREFDYFIHADFESNMHVELILSKTRAKCRIGSLHMEEADFYDFMIKLSDGQGITDLHDQIYHYTKSF